MEEFIKTSIEVHGKKYDYSLVDYKNNKTKVIIICKEHGKFEQRPSEHKIGQTGCKECFKEKCRKNQKIKSNEEIKKELKEIHGDRYDYSLVNYKNNKINLIIICKEHGKFEQRLDALKKGTGCPDCSIHSGFNLNKPSTLYYIKIEKEGKIFYKIGITNNTLKERFRKDFKYIKLLKEWKYKSGKECLKEEQKILNKFSKNRLKRGIKILENGNTEIFNEDVLLLDI